MTTKQAMLIRMPPSPRINIVITAEIKAALIAYATTHGETVTDLIRNAVLEKIGRIDLIESMPPVGRPWPAAEKPKPAPKRKRKS